MNNESAESTQSSDKQRTRTLVSLIVICLVALAAITFGYYTQRRTIVRLQAQQIPDRLFDNYDQCVSEGGLILNTTLSACMGGNLLEDGELPHYQAFMQYSAQNLPRINERKTSDTENRVDNTEGFSADLVAFLRRDFTGCETGYYKIIKEVKDRFALLNYGCAEDEAALAGEYHMIAMKLGDGWSLLSPTGNFNDEGEGVPSCLLTDMFKISQELTPKCFENTGYNDGTIRDVPHP